MSEPRGPLKRKYVRASLLTSSQRSSCSPQPPRQQYRPILTSRESNFPPIGCLRWSPSSKCLATSNEGGSHRVSSEMRPRAAAFMIPLGECRGLSLTKPSGAGFSSLCRVRSGFVRHQSMKRTQRASR